MASLESNNALKTDDDSFIILGSSPGTSLDLKFQELGHQGSLTELQIEEVMKLHASKNEAYTTKLANTGGPSPASLMAASTIITEGMTTEDLQKHYGEILDENMLLKDTLKHNNDSMTEQLKLISSCQEDMLKTHALHKEKFEETRVLVEKLRQENKKLKQELVRMSEAEVNSSQYKSTSSSRSDQSSAVEFVTSPDDDVINKLTAQLGLVEKQRREVIVEKETLTWQKESLESVLDAVTKERDELQEKVHGLQLLLSSKGKEYENEIIDLRAKLKDLQQSQEAMSIAAPEKASSGDHAHMNGTLNFDSGKFGSSKSLASSTESMYRSQIQDLSNRLQDAQISNLLSAEEKTQRKAVTQELENKVTSLQNELKDAKLKILDLESVKLECSQHKSNLSETVKMYKDQIQDVNSRLKVAQTTVFQPVSAPKSQDSETPGVRDSLTVNVRKYHEALKQLANMLNSLVEGSSDCFVQLLGSIASLYDYKLDRSTVDTFKTHLYDAKNQLAKQHTYAVNHNANIKAVMSVLNDLFKDYKDALDEVKRLKTEKPQKENVVALTKALLARGQELQALKEQIKLAETQKEDFEVLKAQCELYKSDFEVERGAREKMATEKEYLLTDLRAAQRSNQEMMLKASLFYHQLDEVRRRDPNLYQQITAKKPSVAASAPTANKATPGAAALYQCPKCMVFKTTSYEILERHFDDCLDDY